MQRDHEVSKTEGRSTASSRGKTGPSPSSGAKALFDLQSAAGNRAVARMLGASSGSGGPGAQVGSSAAGPIVPVSLQRQQLDEALKLEMDGREVDFRRLAKALIQGSDTLLTGPSSPLKEKGRRVKGTETGEKSDTGAGYKVRTAALPGESIPTVKELDERSAKLGRKLTPQELDRRTRHEQIEQRETEEDEAEHLRERERELRRKLTPAEVKNQKKKAELDVLEQQQKNAERETALRRKLTPAEVEARNKQDELDDLEREQQDAEELRQFERKQKPLNPEKKSMGQLLRGRRF